MREEHYSKRPPDWSVLYFEIERPSPEANFS